MSFLGRNILPETLFCPVGLQQKIQPINWSNTLPKSHSIHTFTIGIINAFLVLILIYPVMQPFDFRVKGVTSISVDTHKVI